MIQPHILCWFRFWSHSQKNNTIRWGVFLSLSLFICRLSSIGKTEYNHVYVFTNTFCAIFHYQSITSDLIFCLLNITKASKQHTGVLSRSFSRQVHGLSNRCTFAFANSLAGWFISRYWASLIGLGLRPSRELVWHLSTQGNNGLLVVYITVLTRGRVIVGTSSPSS